MSPEGTAGAEHLPVARTYGLRTANALLETIRITEVGARFVARGRDWYESDPANVPGLAAESLIIKLGENVSRVSDECRADHSGVPWRVIKAMRNRLTHYYEATDYGLIWVTLERDFPEIRGLLETIVGRQVGE